MSKDYPCIHWNDGKCKKFSDDKITSWCVWSPCASQTPSNADRLRSMSDEELADFLEGINACSNCAKRWNSCFPHWDALEWLKKPSEVSE